MCRELNSDKMVEEVLEMVNACLKVFKSFMIVIINNGLRNRLIVIRELLLLCCTTSLFSVTRKTFNFYNYNAVCVVFFPNCCLYVFSQFYFCLRPFLV